MKPKHCNCCKLIYCQRIQGGWICSECDRKPSVRERRTVGQWIEILQLAYKYADHKRGVHTTETFMQMACEPELSMMQLRAQQLKQYKERKGL